MAITVTVEQKKDKEISFPCLMRLKCSGEVVLFTDEFSGTVLVSANTDSHWKEAVGTFADDFASCLDEETWEPSPPITLSNA